MRASQIINSVPNWIWALILFLVALGVRLLHLTDTDIAGDEPFSIFVAQFEPAFIIEYLSTGNNPPLFELILHYWMNVVGDSDYHLRLLPAIFSALTVIPLFLIGSKFFNRQVGLLASTLFTFSTWNIRFAHEVRVYSLLSLLTAISIWFFISIISKPNRSWNWIALALTWVLMLYSHYVAVYIIATQILIGSFLIPREHMKKALAILTVLVVAYIPNLLTFIQRLDEVVGSGGTWVQPPGWGEIYGSINLMLNNRIVVVVLILVLPVGYILNKAPRSSNLLQLTKPKLVLTIGLLFLIPYLGQFFVSKLYLPMFTERYILYASVPLYLTIGWLVNHVWVNAKLPILGPFALLTAMILFGTLKPTNNREVANAVQQVKDWKDEGTSIYVLPEEFELTFAYHYDKDWFRFIGTAEAPKSELRSAMNGNEVFAISSKENLNNKLPNRIICLDAHSEFLHPGNEVLNQFRAHYAIKDSVHFHQIFDVYLFEAE